MNETYEQFKKDLWVALKKKVKGRVYVQYNEGDDILYVRTINKDFDYDWKLKNFTENVMYGNVTKENIVRMFMIGYEKRIDMVAKRRYLKFKKKTYTLK